MKCLTVDVLRNSFVMYIVRNIVYTAVFERISIAVEMVANDWISSVGKVNPDLVGTAGFQLKLHQGVAVKPFQYFIVGDGFLASVFYRHDPTFHFIRERSAAATGERKKLLLSMKP